jgi:hypothetical protein
VGEHALRLGPCHVDVVRMIRRSKTTSELFRRVAFCQCYIDRILQDRTPGGSLFSVRLWVHPTGNVILRRLSPSRHGLSHLGTQLPLVLLLLSFPKITIL